MSWHPIARKQLKGNPVVTDEWGGNGLVQPMHGDCPLLPFTRYKRFWSDDLVSWFSMLPQPASKDPAYAEITSEFFNRIS